MSKWQHVKAIFILPFMVTIVIPAIILFVTRDINFGWFFLFPLNLIPWIAGCIFIGIGLFLIIKTNQLFATVGEGTLAPWDPPKKLVVRGIYRHVRNPMILGVLIINLGEAILFGSIFITLWFTGFLIANHVFFIISEEPDLVRRFGDNYLIYMKNVRRWIPRLKPWM